MIGCATSASNRIERMLAVVQPKKDRGRGQIRYRGAVCCRTQIAASGPPVALHARKAISALAAFGCGPTVTLAINECEGMPHCGRGRDMLRVYLRGSNWYGVALVLSRLSARRCWRGGNARLWQPARSHKRHDRPIPTLARSRSRPSA
jgi:hypothetical protein